MLLLSFMIAVGNEALTRKFGILQGFLRGSDSFGWLKSELKVGCSWGKMVVGEKWILRFWLHIILLQHTLTI
jgi:hypothetical protein